jgi:zinc transporter
VTCCAILAGDGPVREISPEEAHSYHGPGFVWLHVDSLDSPDLMALVGQDDIRDVAAAALMATETRPRCDRIDSGALINLRGPGEVPEDASDNLVSIRMWVRRGKVNSVTRYPLSAMRTVREQMQAGSIPATWSPPSPGKSAPSSIRI